jgi:translation initiation factor SUI1
MDAFLAATTTTTASTAASLPSHEVKKIHIRTQQNGKKWITMVQGLDEDLDQARIARAMKKTLHCSATSCVNEADGVEYIKLSGNQRDLLTAWLVDNEVLTDKEAKARIVLHGA